MINSNTKHDLIEHFNKNDWIYGLDKPRKDVYQELLIYMGIVEGDPQNKIVWRVDDINDKIIFTTVRAEKLTLDPATPVYLQGSANRFMDYLKQNESSKELLDIIDDEDLLTRHLCKQGIQYALSDHSGTNRIHFILDGIDLLKALKEVDNKCVTASEIRELARNIENPNMEHKIYFYRNGVKLEFSEFKNEILKLIADETKSINLNYSPKSKTKRKDENDVKARHEKNKQPKMRPSRVQSIKLFDPLIGLNPDFNKPVILRTSKNFLTQSFAANWFQITDPLINQLKSFIFDPNELSSSINKLYLILDNSSIIDIKNNLQTSLLHQNEFKEIMLQLINQFWRLDVSRPEELKDLSEVDESIIRKQISDSNNAYLLPIRHILNKEFEFVDDSIGYHDIIKLQESIDKIELICKTIFNDASMKSDIDELTSSTSTSSTILTPCQNGSERNSKSSSTVVCKTLFGGM